MTDEAQRTIRIKWVRSGIGFTHRQKQMIRSLGLRKLNQVAERPDTPHIRGLLNKIPHLVVIVNEPPEPAWTSVPEHTIRPPEASLVQAATPAVAQAAEADRVRLDQSGIQERAQAFSEQTVEESAEETSAPSEAAEAGTPANLAPAENSQAAGFMETKGRKAATDQGAQLRQTGKK